MGTDTDRFLAAGAPATNGTAPATSEGAMNLAPTRFTANPNAPAPDWRNLPPVGFARAVAEALAAHGPLGYDGLAQHVRLQNKPIAPENIAAGLAFLLAGGFAEDLGGTFGIVEPAAEPAVPSVNGTRDTGHGTEADPTPVDRDPSPSAVCARCGGGMRPNWKACPDCGEPVAATPGTCAKCGSDLQPQWKACPDCGQPVNATQTGGASPAPTANRNSPPRQSPDDPETAPPFPDEVGRLLVDLDGEQVLVIMQHTSFERTNKKGQPYTVHALDSRPAYWCEYDDGTAEWLVGTPSDGGFRIANHRIDCAAKDGWIADQHRLLALQAAILEAEHACCRELYRQGVGRPSGRTSGGPRHGKVRR